MADADKMTIDTADFAELLALMKLVAARVEVCEQRLSAIERGEPLAPGAFDVLDTASAALARAQRLSDRLRSTAAVIPSDPKVH